MNAKESTKSHHRPRERILCSYIFNIDVGNIRHDHGDHREYEAVAIHRSGGKSFVLDKGNLVGAK
ncbi:hypothetical protein [Bradyrhizobium sp. RT3a]|uniref:hypothetical protein n=1 Tax=unclassified Bradyrhizobium TaxID=2631580 RepID=UPI003399BD07